MINMKGDSDWHFGLYLLIGIALLSGGFFVASLVGSSQSPSGAFLAKNSDRIEIVENKIIASDLTKYVSTEATLKSIFGEEPAGVTVPFNIPRPTIFNKGVLELTVDKKEGGPIGFYLNDNEIYKGSPSKGYSWIEFDRDFLEKGNVLDGKALGGLNPFESTNYKVQVKLSGAIINKFNMTFHETNNRYGKAVLQVYWKSNYGKIIVKVNDQIIYNDEPKDNLNIRLDDIKKKNTIEFLPEPSSKNVIDWAQVVFEK